MSEVHEFQLSISGPQGKRVFRLLAGITTFGRLAECELQLDHPLVSPRHAQVECSAAGCVLNDLGSDTGTFLDGKRLAAGEMAHWPPGAVAQLGPYRLVLGYAGPDRPPGTEEDEEDPQTGFTAEPAVVAVEESSGRVGAVPLPRASSFKDDFGAEVEPLLKILPRRSQRLIHYLPGIYDQDFMQRFLGLFESLLLPLEWEVDHFDLILDPGTTPPGFLAWMANWFEIARRPYWSESQRRALIQLAPQLYARLGTAWALRRALEIYTGQTPEIIEFANGPTGNPAPFTFTVRVSLQENRTTRDEIGDLIDQLKPAHTTCILEFVR